jgi:hypothetical protein
MNPNLSWSLAVASLVALVALAPIVPDEPFHLSGVMFATGLGLAFAGLVTGIGARWSHNDPALRRRSTWAVLVNALTILGVLLALYIKTMSQFEST